MATDDTRLLVRIEASLRQFEREMAKATGSADRAARRIETRFRRMERSLASVGAGALRSFLAPIAGLASAREIGQAIDAYTRIQNALKVAGLEGEAAAQTFDRLFQAAQRNGAPVESLVELYSRAALVQKELGVSAEELQHFTEGVAAALKVSGRSAAESSGALLQLSQALGSGVVRAEEFNSILEGAPVIAQTVARGLEEAGGSVARLRQLVIDGKISSEVFFRAFEAGQGQLEATAASMDSTLGQALTRLQNTLISSIGRLDEATGSSEGLATALDDLGTALSNVVDFFIALDTVLTDIGLRFEDIETAIYDAARAFGDFTGLSSIGPAIESATGWDVSSANQNALDRIDQAVEVAEQQNKDLELSLAAAAAAKRTSIELINAGADIVAGVGITTQPDVHQTAQQSGGTISMADYAPPSSTGGGGGGSRGGGRSPAETFNDDISRIRERTEALQLEAQTVGMSTFAIEKAQAAQDLLNEAKRAGVAITPELLSTIDAEATAHARAAAELEQTEQAYRDLQDLQQFLGDSVVGVFSDIVTGAGSAEDAVRRLVASLADAALQAALLGQGPLAGLFGGSSATGGIGGILGALFGGFRAGGGPVDAGKAYVVGEKQPELFIPRVPGAIVPQVPQGGGTVRHVVDVNPSPLFVTSVRQELATGIAANNGNIPPLMRDRQRRYG